MPTAWAEFFPKPFSTSNLSFTRSPFWDATAAALPMTWSLMSLGMPHAVAKPTAEANTAALEAMDSAQHLANDQMAAYTSALEPASNAASCDQAFNALDAYALMFWPWLSETPATDAPEAA